MKTHSRRYRRQRNPEIQGKKDAPFFTSHSDQSKGDSFFQAKLTVGQPGDQYEQEADKVATAVVNGQPPKVSAIQRKEISTIQAMPKKEEENLSGVMAETPKREEEKKLLMQEVNQEEEDRAVQKKKEGQQEEKKEEEKEKPAVMAKHEPGDDGTNDVPEKLQRKKGEGSSLAPSTLKEMSTAIGADFSSVNIHTDSESAQLNKDLGAQAFTHGNDIYFNSGKYDPASSKGKELLAHELTHVVQQNAAAPLPKNSISHHTSAAAIQKESSTPLPPGVRADKKTKIAKFASGGFLIKILPDKQAKKDSAEVKETGAVTNGSISYRASYKTEGDKVVSVAVTKELLIQTTYGAKAKASDTSAYGRGTTAEDKEKGNTSLKFHEGTHGLDFINYVATHPFPVLEVTEPLTKQEYDDRYSEWEKEAKEYQDAMQVESEKKTDKVGDAVQ